MINQKDKLIELRKKIDVIDEKLLELLTKRFQIAKEIGRIKKEAKIKLRDKLREKEILDRAKNFSKEYTNYLKDVYKAIIKNSLKIQHEDTDK